MRSTAIPNSAFLVLVEGLDDAGPFFVTYLVVADCPSEARRELERLAQVEGWCLTAVDEIAPHPPISGPSRRAIQRTGRAYFEPGAE